MGLHTHEEQIHIEEEVRLLYAEPPPPAVAM
jgi:hypothetical protein